MQPGAETVRFGRYEVLRPIGEGGMARVYLCIQRGAGRFEKRLVLKVLHPKFAGYPDAVAMFLEEARVMARLHHPNIVDVFEVDQVDGVPYIAIEFINGPTLGKLYKQVGRPDGATLGYFVHLMRQVCDGLHYAHTLVVDGQPAGVVHRDVSSQNVVLDASSGLAKLIDFGIAKAVDADRQTQVGILKGRLHYIAPEVLSGARPDGRADLYAVGVILYRLCYGKMPFRDHELVGLRPAPAPQSLPSVPDGLRDIIVRALSQDPAHRQASAAELSTELREMHDALRVRQEDLGPFLLRVFPHGEEDWQQPDPTVEAESLHWHIEPHRSDGLRRLYLLVLAAAVTVFVGSAAAAGLMLAALTARLAAG